MGGSRLVMIPTYNESGNIGDLIRRIRSLDMDLDIIVLDDASSDGTAEEVRKISCHDPKVHLIQRDGIRGRGAAGRDGFNFAVGAEADFLVEMDGDGSHDPEYIPDMLAALPPGGMVIGSRFVAGGCDERSSLLRRIISRFARRFIRTVLGIKVSDPTSGFRCFSGDLLARISPSTLVSDNPFIVLESLFRAAGTGTAIVEVPIRFHARQSGSSKLGIGILFDCMIKVLLLRARGW